MADETLPPVIDPRLPCYGGHLEAIGKLKVKNGGWQVRRYCVVCEIRSDQAISHKRFSDSDMAAMAVIGSNACGACDGAGCDKCVKYPCVRRGCETPYLHVHAHHIAPRFIFGDVVAEQFGTVQLCKPCHTELHAVLNAFVKGVAA